MEFQVEGGYTFQGAEGKTEGTLEVQDLEARDTDVVVGEVTDVGPGGTTQKSVKGAVGVPEDQDGYTPVLEFVKQPKSPIMASVHWLLERTEELNEPYQAPEQLEGEYEGGWNFETEDVMFVGEQYDSEIGRALAIDENPDTEGDAYLELTSA